MANQKEWEKEFDKKFNFIAEKEKGKRIFKTVLYVNQSPTIYGGKEMKQFISKQIQQAKTETIEEIEKGLPKEFKPIDRSRNVYNEEMIKGYNRAIKEIKSYLKQYDTQTKKEKRRNKTPFEL